MTGHLLTNLHAGMRAMVLACTLSGLAGSSAWAACIEDGLMLDHARLRATPPNAPVAAGYLAITNTTGRTQTLISATAPFSRRAEIHDMKHENGVMKMAEIAGGLVLPDGLTLTLMPNSRHLMFTGLDRQLKDNETYPVTLGFAPCGHVTLSFDVVRMPGHSGDPAHSH